MKSYFLRSASASVLLYRMPPLSVDRLRGILLDIAKYTGLHVS